MFFWATDEDYAKCWVQQFNSQTLPFFKSQMTNQPMRSFSTHSWKSHMPWTVFNNSNTRTPLFNFFFSEESAMAQTTKFRGLPTWWILSNCQNICHQVLVSNFISLGLQHIESYTSSNEITDQLAKRFKDKLSFYLCHSFLRLPFNITKRKHMEIQKCSITKIWALSR